MPAADSAAPAAALTLTDQPAEPGTAVADRRVAPQHDGAVAQGGLAQWRPPVMPFRPMLWNRWSRPLETSSGELLPDQPVPLLHVQASAQR